MPFRRRCSVRRRESTPRSWPSSVQPVAAISRRTTRRRGGFRASSQDRRELDRALGTCRADAGRGGAECDRAIRRTRAPRSSSRRSSSSSRSCSREPGASVRQDQPRARRRTASRRRQARSGHRAAANRPPRRRSRSSRRTPSSSTGSTTTRSSAKPCSRLPTPPESPRAGAFGSRSGSRSPPDSAVGAATPRPPCSLRTPRSMHPARPTSSTRIAARIGADVPFFLRVGAQLATGDGTELTPRRASVRLLGRARHARRRREGVDRRGLRRIRRAWRSRRLRGARRQPATARSRRRGHRRDLARLPANDLASSPLARELLKRPGHSARTSQEQARRCTGSSRIRGRRRFGRGVAPARRAHVGHAPGRR